VERKAYAAIAKEYDAVLKFAQAEAIARELRAAVPQEALDFLVLAWHHEHLGYQSGSKPQRYQHKEREFWLACTAGLLGAAFDTLKALVFDKLDSIVRASSLVAMVNSLIRPSLNSCKGQLTQEALNLLMFYHNHRRYKSGKRQGKAPLALLTGKPFEASGGSYYCNSSTGRRPRQTPTPCQGDLRFSCWSTTRGARIGRR
jgi:hypothetical protein